MHPLGTAGRRRSLLELRQTLPEPPASTPSSVNTPPSTNSSENSSRTPIIAITAVSLVIIVMIVFATYLLQHYHTKYINSESTSPSLYKTLWQKWFPNSKTSMTIQQFEPINPYNGANMTMNGSHPIGTRNYINGRTESIRSVITLPAYNPQARQNERVLGREGERGGIDVVVEFPHSAEEEEQRRNDEMEALYQVRLARRRENEQREERRRLRREALESRDPLLREALLRRASDTQVGQTIEELRAEHERLKAQRQRAVSVVSYAEVGVARHDGSRLSMSNQESERIGLLGDVDHVSMSAQSVGRRSTSIRSFDNINSEPPVTPSYEMPSTPHTTHIWGIPGERSRGSRQHSHGSEMSALSPAAIGFANLSLSGPPEYGNPPLPSPSYSTGLPPDYSVPASARSSAENENSTPPESARNTSSETVESHSRAKNIANESSLKLHNRRSSRANLPPVPSIKIDPLPTIRVDPASPLARRSSQALDRVGEPG